MINTRVLMQNSIIFPTAPPAPGTDAGAGLLPPPSAICHPPSPVAAVVDRHHHHCSLHNATAVTALSSTLASAASSSGGGGGAGGSRWRLYLTSCLPPSPMAPARSPPSHERQGRREGVDRADPVTASRSGRKDVAYLGRRMEQRRAAMATDMEMFGVIVDVRERVNRASSNAKLGDQLAIRKETGMSSRNGY
uniref:Uncharacterized protein n=1 Tax=Oryza punctata TaxID=4537 RepID=A0A0E0LC90_ORYPU